MQEHRTIKTDKYTIKDGWLDVGDGHQVYYQQWGNKRAKTPILTFHGGPGGEFSQKHKDLFNPDVHQVIFFDQRGCGNSLPYGEIKHNNPQSLIEDAKKILDKLNIQQIYVRGTSWGSALSLLFAIKFNKLVKAIITGGVFLGTKSEIDFIDKGGFSNFFPDVWDRFISTSGSGNTAEFHYKVLDESQDESKLKASSKALEDLESPLLFFDWPGYPAVEENLEDFDPVPYKIYAHYFRNNSFLSDNYIMDSVDKITCPTYIVQGRYDMVCPYRTAYRLDAKLKNSKLYTYLGGHVGDYNARQMTKILMDTVCI